METDCNLKKLANVFKFLLRILKKLAESDSSLFIFPGETISYFPPVALRAISR